ncbi:hypothetical protein Q3C01_34570 [Bradyrhizobium sp. UFLA05-109]
MAPSVRPWPVPTLRVPVDVEEDVEDDVVGVVDVGGEPAGAPYPLRIPFDEVV